MQRHKIVARIILLILSVIKFALAAPVLVRGTREVRVDVVDVANGVTIPPWKRWNPPDKWWTRTNAADSANAPLSPGLRYSDSHLLPVGSLPPAHNLPLPMDIDSNSPRPNLGPTTDPEPMDIDSSSPQLGLGVTNSEPMDIDSSSPHRSSLGSTGFWSTDAADADSANAPPNLAESDSDSYDWLELALRPPRGPHPNSPINLNPSYSSQESTDWGNSYPLPVDSPQPAHNNLLLTFDTHLNAFPHSNLDSGSPQLAHTLPLNLELSLGPANPANPHLPVDAPRPTHNNLPLDIDLNAPPQPSQETTDGPDSGSHPTGPSIHSDTYHPTEFESSPDMNIYPWEWYETWATWKYPSSSPSPDSESSPPPRVAHGNLDEDSNHPLSRPGLTDDKPPPATPSDPGPSNSEQSLGTYPPPDQEPPPTGPFSPLGSGPSRGANPLSNPGPSTTPDPLSSPGPQQHESEIIFSKLFRNTGSRFKRRTFHSRSANAEGVAFLHRHPDLLTSTASVYRLAKFFDAPATSESTIRRVNRRREG